MRAGSRPRGETNPRNFEELREIDSDFSFRDVEETRPRSPVAGTHFAARLTVFQVGRQTRSRAGAGAVRGFASSLVPGLAERDDFFRAGVFFGHAADL